MNKEKKFLQQKKKTIFFNLRKQTLFAAGKFNLKPLA